MGRVLALDIGKKRIGVAVSDMLFITAQGVGVIERKSWANDIGAVTGFIEEYGVAEIVVGLPKSLDGEIGPAAEMVRRFVERLKEVSDLPVTEWDERFSTAAVERAMIAGGLRRSKRKKVIDMAAAQFILQGYMDYRRVKKLDLN